MKLIPPSKALTRRNDHYDEEKKIRVLKSIIREDSHLRGSSAIGPKIRMFFI